MPRRSEVRYYPTRNAYFTCSQGKQHRLASGPDDAPSGSTYLAALKAFGQLMQSGSIETDKDQNQIQVILEAYMQNAKGRLRETTYTRRLLALRPFQQALGSLPVAELTHFKVEDFIAERRRPRRKGNITRKWGDGSIANFLESANAAFNWARKRKLITTNPLEGFQGPKARSRSRDCIITPEDHQRILKACRYASFRKVIIALENTGARPGELTNARTSDWNEELGAIIYYADDRRREDEFRHKNSGHKDRTIFFTGEALDMVRELVRTRPAGSVLFPSSRGTRYSKTSISNNFGYLRKRLGMPRLSAYSYRHTFATNWLLAGKSIEILAELLGNSPAVILKHYAHLSKDKMAIRAKLEDFKRGQTQRTQTPAPDGHDVDVSARSA
jgi:integrase